MFATAAASLIAVKRFNPEFGRDVTVGLTGGSPKTLSASWLYDEVGSALFEAITVLPEYGLTRADAGLLQQASGELVRMAGHPRLVIELGSGSGTKTRHVLAAAVLAAAKVDYRPIDISWAALENCASALRSLEGVLIDPIEATYLDGIEMALTRRGPKERALILFLGSTIGNFSRPDACSFLKRVRQRAAKGDSLLLGADLVKPRDVLIRAYDDSLGVTAAFNLNLLARINRELDGRFDLRKFAHEARYNERQSRIEMHLRSKIAQEVRIDALDLTASFRAGETIWTESSHKFRAEEIRRMGEEAGWHTARQWVDREWGFSETLFTA
jgi:L-histidine N-alpha-methyltransferase